MWTYTHSIYHNNGPVSRIHDLKREVDHTAAVTVVAVVVVATTVVDRRPELVV
jgi:hypothetical protein